MFDRGSPSYAIALCKEAERSYKRWCALEDKDRLARQYGLSDDPDDVPPTNSENYNSRGRLDAALVFLSAVGTAWGVAEVVDIERCRAEPAWLLEPNGVRVEEALAAVRAIRIRAQSRAHQIRMGILLESKASDKSPERFSQRVARVASALALIHRIFPDNLPASAVLDDFDFQPDPDLVHEFIDGLGLPCDSFIHVASDWLAALHNMVPGDRLPLPAIAKLNDLKGILVELTIDLEKFVPNPHWDTCEYDIAVRSQSWAIVHILGQHYEPISIWVNDNPDDVVAAIEQHHYIGADCPGMVESTGARHECVDLVQVTESRQSAGEPDTISAPVGPRADGTFWYDGKHVVLSPKNLRLWQAAWPPGSTVKGEEVIDRVYDGDDRPTLAIREAARRATAAVASTGYPGALRYRGEALFIESGA